MKPVLLMALLVAINFALALRLGREADQIKPLPRIERAPSNSDAFKEAVAVPKIAEPPPSEYAAIYSQNSKQFVTNLRAIGCPEETIKDILVAEISRRYAGQEAALRPTPADHVPFGWSAKTVEGKLIARRQEAASIARSKSAALKEALGYEIPVHLPNYAMTTSDQAFERLLNFLPIEQRARAQQIQESYWAEVEQLRERTRGFWLPEDVAALNELKARRQELLSKLNAP